MKLSNQKHLFNLPKDVTYLNIASLSPAFKAIEEAGIESILKKSRPNLLSVSDFFDPVVELKKLFAELIDVDEADRIALSPSVSYGIANVVNNITLKPTDEVLIIDEQFPSNYYSWKKLTDTYNATLKVVKAPEVANNKGKQWNELILEAISEHTAVVSMGQVHWSNGTLFDLKAIRQKTKENNALLIIDGSQSVGTYPFSVQEIEPDALVCAGYKWLFGPYGGAFAYYGPYFDHGNPIEENWINRLDSEDFAGLTEYQDKYKPFANRYTSGEAASFITVQMRIAALKQVLDWQPERIQEYCKGITQKMVKQLRNLGCVIENDEDRTHHMFGVGFPDGFDMNLLKQKFQEQKVYVSFRGNFLRISCHLFTTEEDFEVLIKSIRSCMEAS